jgi:hypothetical protein
MLLLRLGYPTTIHTNADTDTSDADFYSSHWDLQLFHLRLNSKRCQDTPLQQHRQRKNALHRCKGLIPHRRKDKKGKDETVGGVMSQYLFSSSLGWGSSQAQGASTKSSTHICTKSSDSLVGIKSLGFPTQVLRLPKSKRKVLLMAKIDKWGCIHLGAADCVLAMTFPGPHCEVWDMRDE